MIYDGYGEPIEGYGELPWWRPQYNFQQRFQNPFYNAMSALRPPGWVRPNPQSPGPAGRRWYMRCMAWRGAPGMVPGPGMHVAQPGMLPPGAPGMLPPGAPGFPGMPGAPGMPPGMPPGMMMGGGRRRRRRRR